MTGSPDIYLDNNATTQPLPEVVESIAATLSGTWANPSSTHRPGMAARYAVERARASVAALLGVSERNVIFTSGATESIAIALIGAWRAAKGEGCVITSATEHSAVFSACTFIESMHGKTMRVPVGRDGAVDPAVLERLMRSERAAAVSIALANNETGVMQDVKSLALLVKSIQPDALVHTDATQAVGKVPVDMRQLGVDLLSCSAHKCHGPKGVGALCLAPGIAVPPMVEGSQERGRRGGTEAVASICGFGVAAESARQWLGERDASSSAGRSLRDLLEATLLGRLAEQGAVVHGVDSPRLWNTTSIGFPGLEAEALVVALSERGLAVGAGAACASGSLEPSPALLAMGIPEPLAHGTVRLSLSRFTTESEVRVAIELIVDAVEAMNRAQ